MTSDFRMLLFADQVETNSADTKSMTPLYDLRLLPRMSVANAPSFLNLNDQAIWLYGWNDAIAYLKANK